MTATGPKSGIAAAAPGSHATIPALLVARAGSHPDTTILRKKDRGIWKATTWAQLGARAREIGMALRAHGLSPGEVVCVLSDTMPEWVYADLGIQGAGCISAGLYPSSDADEVVDILGRTGARVLFVEDEEQLDKALVARDRCPDLERIVIFDMKGLRDLDDPAAESLADFMARGAEHADAHPGEWEAGVAALRTEAVAVLAFTPGTAGPSKAAMLSHRNVLTQVNSTSELLGLGSGDERLAFLPMSHVVERVLGLYLALSAGIVSNYIESPDTIADNMREVSPTVFIAPPRDWERFRGRVMLAVLETTWLQRFLFNWAMRVGERVADVRLAGREPSAWLRLQRLVGSAIALRPVRESLGLSRVRIAVATGEPIAEALVRWYLGLGIDLVETYSQTECAGFVAVAPGAAVLLDLPTGPIPHGEIRVSDAGEVQVRGAHIFAGYWKDEAASRAALSDGWFSTGDVGGTDGSVTGRLGDVIATGTGQRIQPAPIEAELRTSAFIADCVLFGTSADDLCGLVSVDQDAVEKWAQKSKIPFTGFANLVASDAVRDLIAAEIRTATAGSNAGPAVTRFHLIERSFEIEDPELSPMLKFRRERIASTFKDRIEAMSREV